MKQEFRIAILLTILAVLIAWAHPAEARVIAVANHQTIAVTLTDELCAVQGIANLPFKAVWTDKGKTFQGCFDVRPEGFVIAYFDDRTVALIPVQHFKPLESM